MRGNLQRIKRCTKLPDGTQQLSEEVCDKEFCICIELNDIDIIKLTSTHFC